jgi:hypothetical protein
VLGRRPSALSALVRSGGLGLSRTAWELLHGKPDRIVNEIFLYQGKTYKVTYQHDIVWQLEKAWERPGIALAQVRARIRRYVPLDSHYVRTDTVSDDTVVDIYQSNALAQRLAQAPPRDRGTADLREGEPVGTCVAVHYLTQQSVTATLFQIGNATQISRLTLPRENSVPAGKSKEHHTHGGAKVKTPRKAQPARH